MPNLKLFQRAREKGLAIPQFVAGAEPPASTAKIEPKLVAYPQHISLNSRRESQDVIVQLQLPDGSTQDVLEAHGRGRRVKQQFLRVVEVEEQIPTGSLTPTVRDGLQGKAGNGKIVKVETLTKKGRLVAYEAQIRTNGKKSEVQVGPDGKPLDHEE